MKIVTRAVVKRCQLCLQHNGGQFAHFLQIVLPFTFFLIIVIFIKVSCCICFFSRYGVYLSSISIKILLLTLFACY